MNLPPELLEQVRAAANVANRTDAVIIALQEYLKRRHRDQVLDQAGKLDFADDLDEIRHER
jgi:Arc/MetJ family transcription regulator